MSKKPSLWSKVEDLSLSSFAKEKLASLNPDRASGLFLEQIQTPIMQQYENLKETYPNCLLCFQLGEFYEFFGLDALIVSDLYQLTLTARNKNQDFPIFMAGVPLKQLEDLITYFLTLDLPLAVAEQVQHVNSNQLVSREVTSVYTPSLSSQPSEQKGLLGIFLASLTENAYGFQILFFENAQQELSFAEQIQKEELLHLLNHYQPMEILVPKQKKDFFMLELQGQLSFQTRWLPTPKPQTQKGFQLDFNSSSFPFHQSESATRCYEQMVEYLASCFPQQSRLSCSLITLKSSQFLKIQEKTLRHLEIFVNEQHQSQNCFAPFFNQCVTPMGRRLFHQRLHFPLRFAKDISLRQEFIRQIQTSSLPLTKLQSQLKVCRSLHLPALQSQKYHPKPQNFLDLLLNHQAVQTLLSYVAPQKSLSLWSESLSKKLALSETLMMKLKNTLNLEGWGTEHWVNKNHPLLKNLKEEEEKSLENIQKLFTKIKEEQNLDQLKLLETRQQDWVFEVPNGKLNRVPSDFQMIRSLTNSTRFSQPELKQEELKLKEIRQQLTDLIQEIEKDLQTSIEPYLDSFKQVDAILGEMDVTLLSCFWLEEPGWSLPTLFDEGPLSLKSFFHPLLNEKQQGQFIRNHIQMGGSQPTVCLLTGPNMSGKSTLMRQVGLIQILAQAGFPVPAQEAFVETADEILTRIGSGDDSYQGLSTFMVEMLECAYLFEQATEKSLLLIDEIGRGTSTTDGMALAQAILEELCLKRRKALFSTHYHHLQKLTHLHQQILHLEVIEKDSESFGQLLFTYQLKKGGSSESYGLHVAKLSGVPSSIIERASYLRQVSQENKTHKFSEKEINLT